jgi:hypothetical protein
VLEPNAAGIEVGARDMSVAMPPGPDENPVRVFATFTEDLERLTDWLDQCGVTTVALESIGSLPRHFSPNSSLQLSISDQSNFATEPSVVMIARVAGINCPPRCLSQYEYIDRYDSHPRSFESLVGISQNPCEARA